MTALAGVADVASPQRIGKISEQALSRWLEGRPM